MQHEAHKVSRTVYQRLFQSKESLEKDHADVLLVLLIEHTVMFQTLSALDEEKIAQDTELKGFAE
jgi:hypothetical protein